MSLTDGLEHIIRDGEPLAPHTWFQLGGAAEYFAEPTNVDELSELVRRCNQENIHVRVLGGGSNLLVRDEGVPGVVIHLSAPAFTQIQVDKQTVTAGGGAVLGHVVSTSVREGLAGMDSLVGIPGTIGGALRHNSGAQSGDIGQWTASATVLTRTGEIVTHERSDLRFAHRSSSLDELVILNATFELEEDDPKVLTRRLQKLWIVKKASQPSSDQKAGCIFKDSRGMTAANLIDDAGLKGTRVGEAEVSDRNANFIVANPGCSTSDVMRLIDLIQSRVAERSGCELEQQIDIW